MFNKLSLNPDSISLPKIVNEILVYGGTSIKPTNIFEGKLEIERRIYPQFYLPLEIEDSLKLTIQILDRDYNFSNTAEIERIIYY